MALNMKTLTQALARTAAVIEKTVQTTVQEVTGPKPLQDFELLDQIGSAGPGLAWKLYSAKSVRDSTLPQQYPQVCVWVLDKRVLSEVRARAGLSKTAEDSFLDIIRADAARLVRLRHPGVVHVVQALDENKNAMAMVTEPLFASVANALGNLENVTKVPKELKGMEMGLLEVKHGLLQMAETLDFLHNNASLVHRSISPGNILITANGAWKLGGFGFAISTDQASGDLINVPAFHYTEYDVEDSVLPLQPSLNYTAPELVRSKSPSVGTSADVFSFGCLAYHLIAWKPLFDCHNNVKMYMNTLTYLSREAFSSIPPELVPDLQRMLSVNESFRPTALDFTGSPFLRDDTRLRALRFLDHMLERDNMQKSEFLKALSDMWKDFDSRVLRYKVLPPLCAELRNLVMQPMILPMVLTIAESQDKNDFELSTLPALVPVLSTAVGDTLLLLVKHAELIIGKTSQEQLISHVLPSLVRAYDDNDARIQEEVLKKSAYLSKQLDIQLVKQAILPRVHGLALKTTVAAVRVNALLCLGELVPTLDKRAALDILQTIQRCTAVDHSAPTLMCTLGVANSMLKQYGVEFAAEHVLPLLTPLLTAQQLNVQQFAKYMLFVKDILRKIEEKRGVTVTETGGAEMNNSLGDGALSSQAFAFSKATVPIVSAAKSGPAWDDDWGIPSGGPPPAPKDSATNAVLAPVPPSISSSASQSIQMPSLQTLSSSMPSAATVGSTQQSVTTTCAPVADIEWPPRASSMPPHQSNDAKQQQLTMTMAAPPSTQGFDDIDPFADWPPRPAGGLAGVSGASNGNTAAAAVNPQGLAGAGKTSTNNAIFPANSSNSWAFSSSYQGNPGLIGNSSHNSIGSSRQSHGSSNLQGHGENRLADIGSIFGTNKKEQASAPRLAPPPSTAVGRGRGRGMRLQSSTSRSTTTKSSSEQPPLLDLL
ncbi:hypothetical protein CDL15_Pgr029135 [Punica granatum]|uniref:Protein kinase domain-containing protein n=1 Tax=Punica granatum TaxID=22663 RepID=A0A218XN35_PUNGR|nr:hypothetical protein CDL15_Pgr029135 [Punica granatum]